MATTMTVRAAACRALEGAGRILAAGGAVERLRRRDHTLWKRDPQEIADRLGWLESPRQMGPHLAEIRAVVDGVRAEGFEAVLLLGMGGSSLAPEVFRKVFGVAAGFLDLAVLDSTDPGAVQAMATRMERQKTLCIVSTKSGGTVETFSFLKFFYTQAVQTFGAAEAGRRFLAITDPGSAIAGLAETLAFRHCFLNDPNIGGRYSALSLFGLVPAALIGMDLERLLASAAAAAAGEFAVPPGPAGGALLGALLGDFAAQGRDKLTFVFSPAIAPFGDWLEQLLAESTGKEGEGILPVVGEPLGDPAGYGDDRLFVSLRLGDDATGEERLRALAAAGQPVVDLRLEDPYDLGGQCYFWEVATALAGWRLAVNPFDQPDVEAAKALARQMIAEYRQKGEMAAETPALQTGGVSVYGTVTAADPAGAVRAFLGRATPGAYIAIQAYLTPAPETGAALERLRAVLRHRLRLPVTVGYGPRFLHSTGQLHKGDAGCGFFLQLTADDPRDVPIPDEPGRPGSSLSFGVLKAAQARGDRQALLAAGRAVLRLHFRDDPAAGVARLAALL